MNSQDMWIKLYDMDTKEIEIQFTMMFIYLVKDRNIPVKEVLSDLKNVYKKIGKR